jgi:serine/threonine protein kinase/Tfp pilus assembly protein PilF
MQFAHFKFDPETDRIGEGALSEVYRAEDTNLGRQVALKILRAHAEIDPQAERRFKREAKHASSLDHEHIATIYEYGEDHGTSFIAMEFLEGETLDKVIKERTLGFEECLRIAEQVTSALSLVHEAGILHRDLKPGNILLQPDGKLKLLDFGIARARDETGITQQGVLVGTVLYMSPEQVRGDDLDLRSDVFSLGAVLYHISTGTLPFPGDNFPEVCMAILDGKIKPPTEVRHGFPKPLEEFLFKCLEGEPDDRFVDAREVHGALIRVAEKMSGTRTRAQVRLRGTLILPPTSCALDDTGSCAIMAGSVRKDLASALSRHRELEVVLTEDNGDSHGSRVDYVVDTRLDVQDQEGRLELTVRFPGEDSDADDPSAPARVVRDTVKSKKESEWALQESLVRSAMRVLRKRLTEAPLRADALENEKTRAAVAATIRGMAVLRKGTTKHLLAASAKFRKALELDRYCALAHVGLAEALVRKFLTWDGDPTFLDEARERANRALSLDPQCALAHTVLGFAYHLSGRLDQAQREYRLAYQTDSNEWLCHRLLGAIESRAGNFKGAAPLLQKAIDLCPTHIGSYDHLYGVLQRMGRYEEALVIADAGIAAAHKHLRDEPDDMDARAHMALLMARRGSDDAARKAIEAARDMAPRDGTTAFHAACVYALLGDPPAAIEALGLAQDRGYYIASELGTNSDLDILRGLPEFQELH